MRILQTSAACPEQYDVFDGPRLVGYFRLRWSQFSAYYLPNGKFDKDARLVHSHVVDGTALTGSFSSDEQRQTHLNTAMKKLRAEVNYDRKETSS